MELVEQDAGLRGVAGGRLAKGLPHVHDDEANARRLAGPEPRVELVQARLRAIRAPKPDRPLAHQVADDDAVSMAPLIETSSSPSTRGPGVPARRSCSRMYCCSSAFTVCQSSRSSLATSRMGEARQRRPT